MYPHDPVSGDPQHAAEPHSPQRAETGPEHSRDLWTLASTLTSGLLANQSRGHFSVKDTISLFDEVLNEISSYARVRGDYGAYAEEVIAAQSAQPAAPETFTGGSVADLRRNTVPLPGAAPAPQPPQETGPRQPQPLSALDPALRLDPGAPRRPGQYG